MVIFALKWPSLIHGRSLINGTVMTHVLHLREVVARTGRSRSSLWRDVKEGRFPAPVRIGKVRIGWLETEVMEWQENLDRVWQPPAEVERPETGDESDEPVPAAT